MLRTNCASRNFAYSNTLVAMPLNCGAALLAAGKMDGGSCSCLLAARALRVGRSSAIVAGRLYLPTIRCLIGPDRKAPGSASMPRANANSCQGALRLTEVYPLRSSAASRLRCSVLAGSRETVRLRLHFFPRAETHGLWSIKNVRSAPPLRTHLRHA